jgi:hypothetical protein
MQQIGNYTFSNVIFTIPEGDNVSSLYPTGVITISAVEGYTVDFNDFSLNPLYSDPNVDSVIFTQSGDDVLCTVTFDIGFVMPSDNITLDICILGEAYAAELTIAGEITTTIAAELSAGDTSETLTPYTNTGLYNTFENLFTRTYTATAGYYFGGMPLVTTTATDASNYNIVSTPTLDGDGNITSVLIAVGYTYPSYSNAGDLIKIKASRFGEIYDPVVEITGYTFNTSRLSNPSEIRTLNVYGTPTTTFGVDIYDGTTTTSLLTGQVMPDAGFYSLPITFPELIKGDPNVTYEITLTGDGSGTLDQPNPIVIEQLNTVTISFDYDNEPTPITGWALPTTTTFKALSFNPSADLLDSGGIWLVNVDYTITPFSGTGTLSVIRQVEHSDFSNVEEIVTQVDGLQSGVTSLTLDDTTGILPSDKFNNYADGVLIDPTIAPFKYSVVSVDSATDITITPSGTFNDNKELTFIRSNGNNFSVLSSDVTEVDPLNVNIKFSVAITNFGDADVDFDLDLSNIITYTP